jgi:hypothetical protein
VLNSIVYQVGESQEIILMYSSAPKVTYYFILFRFLKNTTRDCIFYEEVHELGSSLEYVLCTLNIFFFYLLQSAALKKGCSVWTKNCVNIIGRLTIGYDCFA